MGNQKFKEAFLFITFGVLIGLFAGGAIYLVSALPRGTPVTLVSRTSTVNITIFITGEVVHPGVFQLPYGSRVLDALNQAGGFTSAADRQSVNLASLLVDGQQININSVFSSQATQSHLININTADLNQLMELPGIGVVTAQAIIDFRTLNGNFKTIEELQKVSGIGPSTYNQIKDLITVGN